jgi:DNA-directed RNA polymerase subunit M/transcription elongation factor TFIIS
MSKGLNKSISLPKPISQEKRTKLIKKLVKDLKISIQKVNKGDNEKLLLPKIDILKFVEELEQLVYDNYHLLGSLDSYHQQLITLRYNLINNSYYLLKNYSPKKLSKMKTFELGQGFTFDFQEKNENENENERKFESKLRSSYSYYPIDQFKNDLKMLSSSSPSPSLSSIPSKESKKEKEKEKEKYDVSQLQRIVEEIETKKIDPLLILKDEKTGKIIIQFKNLEQCKRCKGGKDGKNKVTPSFQNSRSADEGQVIFCVCDCGHNWKIYN